MKCLNLYNKKNKTAKKYLIGMAALLCGFSGLAIASDECSIEPLEHDHPLLCARPEVGIDVGFTKTQFKQEYSVDKLLNRNQIPFNVFFGLNMTDHFGFEVGYGETRSKNKEVRLAKGEAVPGGDPVGVAPAYQVYDTSVSTSQPYISLKYKHPIGEKLQLFGAVGVAFMKMNASWDNIEDQTNLRPPRQASSRTKHISQRKTIPLVKVGLYYPLVKSFSLRFVATWLQTSKMQIFVSPPTGLVGWNSSNINVKNSIHYSIGVVYTI